MHRRKGTDQARGRIDVKFTDIQGISGITVPSLKVLIMIIVILSLFFSLIGTAYGEEFEKHDDSNDREENRNESRSVNGTGLPPQLGLNKTFSPEEIWIKGSINQPQETNVRLNVSGIGDPRIVFDPQDVVFIMDTSGSMDLSDPANYRYTGARGYVEKLLQPDRAAVVQFGYDAWLVNDHHLSWDYDQVIDDLAEDPKYRGQTNYEAAVSLANNELIKYSEPGKFKLEIFFTDGNPDPKTNNITSSTLKTAVDNNIMIYTIGLEWKFAPNPLDEDLLKWMARSTGGEYFKATDPEQLIEIYQNISKRFTITTAGSDLNVTDNEPMIREVIPEYLIVNKSSFNIKPDYMGTTGNGSTILEWNTSSIGLKETWIIEYRVSSKISGNVSLSYGPQSRVQYHNWEGVFIEDHFKTNLLWVKKLPPPPPPPLKPPPPPPPPPPSPSFGVPPPNPSLPIINPVVTLQPQLMPLAFETAAAVPAGFAFAGFAALGLMERIKMKHKIKGKHKVAIGA